MTRLPLRTYPKTTGSRPAASAILNENRVFGPALNRTALAGLALFFLFITPMTLVAEEPAPVKQAVQTLDKQQKEKMQLLEKELKLKQEHGLLILHRIASLNKEMERRMHLLKSFSRDVDRRGLSKKDQEELIGKATSSEYETKIAIAVKEALIAHLEKRLQAAKPPKAQLQSAGAKLQTLEKQKRLAKLREVTQFRKEVAGMAEMDKALLALAANMDKAETAAAAEAAVKKIMEAVKKPEKDIREQMAKMKQAEQMAEAANAKRLHAIRYQIALEKMDARLGEAKLETALMDEKAKKPIADKIAELKTELVGLKVKRDITMRYLNEYINHSRGSGDIGVQLMQYKIDASQRKIQRWQEELTDVKIEMCRLEVEMSVYKN